MDDKKIRTQANPAFRYVIEIEGEALGAFTECTLPTIEWETEELKEGGLNTHTHMLPGRRKGARITLKNGVGKSKLLSWYIETMNEVFSRKPVTISILDTAMETVQTWEISNAYPVKWSGPQLKADANTLAIQSIEFVCGEVSIS